MDTTFLENWHVWFTACCKKSGRILHCRLWNIGRNTWPQTFRDLLRLMRKTFFWNSLKDKVGTQNLRTEFRCDERRFVQAFMICLLSTVDSRSLIGQGIYELLLPCNRDWWGLRRSFSAAQQAAGWAFREGWPERAKLKRAGLSNSPLCRNSGSWSCLPSWATLT